MRGALWGWLLACGGEAPDPVARYAEAPDAVLAELEAMPAGPERDALALRLLDAHPGQTAALCPALPEGPLRARCENVNSRPHLHTPATNRDAPARGARALDALDLPFVSPAPDPGPCAPEGHACLAEQAAALARAGQAEAAAARCAADTDRRWRQECYFQAAEATPPGAERLGAALGLCGGAGGYAAQCVGHVFLVQLGAGAPPAVEDAERVARAAQDAGVEDLWWCLYAHRLAEQAPERLLAPLPPAAAPHARSALAAAAQGAPDPRAAYLAALRGEAVPPALRVAPDRASERLTWHRDHPGEEDIPAIPFLHNGVDRRATDPDPSLDAELAWLSALGHADPLPVDALAAALEAEHALLRWTAARILVQALPEHPALARAAEDPDPRVRARSKPGFAPKPSKRARD